MASRTGVVILGGGRGTRLEPLTTLRAKPAVPIGGKYRLVDIPISNAIHSELERMILLTQFNSVSLHRHIQRTYQFDDFSRGWIQIIAAQQTPRGEGWFQGTADAIRQTARFVDELADELVLILAGDHIYRMDYREMIRTHRSLHADVTVAVQPCSEAEVGGFGVMRADDSQRVTLFREKPRTPEAKEDVRLTPEVCRQRHLPPDKPFLASMGIYLFDKGFLLEMLGRNLTDFGGDVIPAAVEDGRMVAAHLFTGYWRDIGTIGTFFETHMDLVKEDPPFRFDDEAWPIYTRPRFLPPARVSGARVDRTLLGDGALIFHSTLEDVVVGVRSHIRGADIRRTLIMGEDPVFPNPGPGAPPPGIGEGTVIRNAIIDKNARIGRNVRILNEAGQNEIVGDGWQIHDGIVVVSKNSVIPDGTVI